MLQVETSLNLTYLRPPIIPVMSIIAM